MSDVHKIFALLLQRSKLLNFLEIRLIIKIKLYLQDISIVLQETKEHL